MWVLPKGMSVKEPVFLVTFLQVECIKLHARVGQADAAGQMTCTANAKEDVEQRLVHFVPRHNL